MQSSFAYDCITEFGKALDNAEEDAFLNGDGKGKPLGIFAKTDGGQSAGTLTAALGLVNDMYAENSNDDYKGYKEVATQEDFDKFK